MPEPSDPTNDYVADPTVSTDAASPHQHDIPSDMGNPMPPVSPPVMPGGDGSRNLPSGDNSTPSDSAGGDANRAVNFPPGDRHEDSNPVSSPTHDTGPTLGGGNSTTSASGQTTTTADMHDPGSRMPTSADNHDHTSSAQAYPPPYTGGAPVVDSYHLANGATVTETASGARVEQMPGHTAYQVHPPEHDSPLVPAGGLVTPDGERHGAFIPNSDPVSAPGPAATPVHQPEQSLPPVPASSLAAPGGAQHGAFIPSSDPEPSASTSGPVMLDHPHGPVPSASHGINFGVSDSETPAHHPGRQL